MRGACNARRWHMFVLRCGNADLRKHRHRARSLDELHAKSWTYLRQEQLWLMFAACGVSENDDGLGETDHCEEEMVIL